MQIEFLGTGTSSGVPVINCSCDTCLSKDSKDKRYRSSLKVEKNNKILIIDTGPEFRLSALRSNIKKVDLVLYTHSHFDHLYGLDDLKPFTKDKPLNIYTNHQTIKDIKNKFSYCFTSSKGVPNLLLNNIDYYETKNIEGFNITNIPVEHGKDIISSYKIDDLVYLTDCSNISAKSINYLKNPKVLVIGALRYKPHFKHFNVEQAIKVSKELKAEYTIFTHINHNIKHSILSNNLEENIVVGYDTMVYSF